MRRSLVAAALVAIAALPGTSEAVTWEWGMHGGFSISHFVGTHKDSLGADFKPGVAGHIWGKSNFTENLGLRLELGFVQKGGRESYQEVIHNPINETTVIADIQATNKFNYVEIPILFAFTDYNETFNRRIGIYAGPALNFNVGATQTRTFGDEEEEIDFKDVVQSFEVSGMAGVEAYFRVGLSTFITLDFRYSYGNSHVLDDGRNLDVHNSAFQLMMGFMIPLGAEPFPAPEVEGLEF